MPALAFPLGIGGGLGGSLVGTSPIVLSADPWALDMIEVVFNQEMLNDASTNAAASYAVTSTTAGAPLVTVLAVRPDGGGPVTRVFLDVGALVVGALYTVTVSASLKDVTGIALDGGSITAQFIGRRTKIDSAVGSRPTLYDMGSKRRLRNVLNAIMRSDDLIGGSRKDRILPAGSV